MELLHAFFQINRQPVLFVYGLSFFVLGLAIALQSRQHSRLDLAASLPWLAAFGLLHGLDEWGDLFVPIQTPYLNPPAIWAVNLFQMLLLAASFACLLTFGLLLLHPSGRARWLYSLPVALLLIWAGSVVLFGWGAVSPIEWHRAADAVARYAIGFPGALLAAYSLHQQVQKRIAPLNVPHMVQTLQIAVVALALYAVFGGLIPAPVPFFPGNVVNFQTFEAATGFPPSVIRSVIGLLLAVATIHGLDIFDLETERFIESMEQQQILAAERERIAGELHDGVIQKVYTAGLLVDSARTLIPEAGPASARLDRAAAVLNDAIADLRRHLGELHPASTDTPLAESLQRLGSDPRFQALLDLRLEMDLPENDSLSPSQRGQVIAVVQEALSNIVRHAGAQHACIHARRDGDRLELMVEDDGVGLPALPAQGYGLRNMRDRARILGGEIQFSSEPGPGTQVRLSVPWKELT